MVKFNNITYKRKNRLLYLAASVLFVICIFFSFSNTWNVFKKNKVLSRNTHNNLSSSGSYEDIAQKYNKLDTLIKVYTADSLLFETNFLSNISLAIHDLPIELSYDENTKRKQETATTKSSSFSLKGDYKDIIRAIYRLEKDFFISRMEYSNGNYVLEIIIFKMKHN